MRQSKTDTTQKAETSNIFFLQNTDLHLRIVPSCSVLATLYLRDELPIQATQHIIVQAVFLRAWPD